MRYGKMIKALKQNRNISMKLCKMGVKHESFNIKFQQ